MDFFYREENREPGEKPSEQGKGEADNKLNPLMALSRSLTRATLLGGKRSHHCVIPAPLKASAFKISLS